MGKRLLYFFYQEEHSISSGRIEDIECSAINVNYTFFAFSSRPGYQVHWMANLVPIRVCGDQQLDLLFLELQQPEIHF